MMEYPTHFTFANTDAPYTWNWRGPNVEAHDSQGVTLRFAPPEDAAGLTHSVLTAPEVTNDTGAAGQLGLELE
jgi:hypothetical protein